MALAYWGSKKRFARDIVEILCGSARAGRAEFYEPFCGMCSVSLEALRRGCFKKVHCSDTNPDVISYWEGIARGWAPPDKPLTQGDWDRLRSTKRSSPRRSFYGFQLGYGGHFLAGRSPTKCMNAASRMRSARSRLREATALLRENSHRWSASTRPYQSIRPSRGSVVYVDPPYLHDGSATTNRRQHFSKEQMDELWSHIRGWIEERDCAVFMSAATPPVPPSGLHVSVVKKWTISNRIGTSKTGKAQSRVETLLRVTSHKKRMSK